MANLSGKPIAEHRTPAELMSMKHVNHLATVILVLGCTMGAVSAHAAVTVIPTPGCN